MSDDHHDTTGPSNAPDASDLASVYLDDEATRDERALVETSPETLDEVRRFADVRSVLGATAPTAALAERESHLAAALDVWEATGGSTVAAPPATTSAQRTRRRTALRSGGSFGPSQWFLSAAAVLVVVAGGAAIARGILDAPDAQDDVALEATDAGPELDALERDQAAEVAGENVGSDAVLSESQIEDEVAVDGSADDSGLFASDAEEADADEAADEAMQDEAMEEDGTEEPDDPVATSTGLDDADPPEGGVQPSPAPENDLVELVSPEMLGDFGSLVVPAIGNSPSVTSDIDFEAPFDTCEDRFSVEEIVGPASYQGTTVTVGVDVDGQVVFAYTSDCELVASAPLPQAPADVAGEPDESNDP